MEGVTIKVKGAGMTITTDAGGGFIVKCPEDAVLIFSFVGFSTKELRVRGVVSPMKIVMEAAVSTLNDVVVVGYGVQTKKEFTGSVATVSGEKIKDVSVQSFDQALAGKAAGVNITQPNGVLNNAPVIRIRGINSISLDRKSVV